MDLLFKSKSHLVRFLCFWAWLYFVLLGSSLTDSQLTLTWDEQPSSQTVKKGATVTFRCAATVNRKIEYYWSHNNETIQTNSRITIKSADGTLEITHTQLEDRGTYQCYVTRAGRTKILGKSNTATLDVKGICQTAQIIVKSGNSLFLTGSDIQIRCKCYMNPSGTYTFSKDGATLNSGGHITVDRNKVLIKNATTEDSGSYACTASLHDSAVTKTPDSPLSISVIVGQHPQFLQPPPATSWVKEGKLAKIPCKAIGNPTPIIRWYADGDVNPLQNSSKYRINADGSLEIKNADSQDAIMYKCTATNLVNRIAKDNKLELAYLDDVKFDASTLYILKNYKTEVLCKKPKGSPVPSINWLKGGQALPPKFRKQGCCTLEKNGTKIIDTGNYTCVATNSYVTKSKTIQIVVSEQPQITQKPDDQTLKEDEKAVLNCTVKSVPPAKISWWKDGKEVQEDREHIFEEVDGGLAKRLVIPKVKPSDNGTYECLADHPGGWADQAQAILVVKVPPPLVPISPPDKGAIHSNSFRIKLAKASDENGKVSYYQVIVIELATDNKGKAVPAQPPDYYKREDLYTYNEARKKKPTLVPYIAAEFNAMDFDDYEIFTVGDGRRSSRAKNKTSRRRRKEVNRPFEFFNGPLEGGTLYAVFLRAYIKEDVYRSSPWIDPVETVSTSSNPNLSPIEVLSKEATVALSVVGAILFLCIVLGFAFFCFIRHQRKQILEYRNQLFPVSTGKHQIDPNRTLLEQCNDLPYDPDFEFPEDKLILGELLGSGAFGKVIKAEAIGINNFSPRDKSQKKSQRLPKMFRQHRAGHAYHDPRGSAYTKTIVAVKTVKGGATKEEVRDLASELKILIYVGDHKNIVNLLGACIKLDRILVILEYAPHGSLQKFLRGKRDVYEAIWTTNASDPEIGLNISNLVNYSYQISRGMEYLASKKCVHRDLAARNVLVGKDYVMKIADFGLARNIYKGDLYVKTNSGVLPMKWMAIESLCFREYSEKSDVWSFGICLWEIFTLGLTPYPTLPVKELLGFLNDGNRMENPQDCPSEIYKIMQDCWQGGPDKRPKFDQISQSIGTILEQRAAQSVATEYLHLTEDNNSGRKNYYLDPHDSDPTVPVTRADVYDRRSSENIANNPLPPLPGDMEDQFDPESEERRQLLKPEIYGGSSGSEGDVELEEFHGNEQAVALELTPIAHATEKAGNSKKKTTII